MEETNGKHKEEELTIEEARQQLEAVLEQLEGGECSLEKSFSLYKKGMELVRYMDQCVDRIEKQMIQIEEREDWDEL